MHESKQTALKMSIRGGCALRSLVDFSKPFRPMAKNLSENRETRGKLKEKRQEVPMPRTRPWEVTDEFWERVQSLIPPTPPHAKGGRPRLSDRRAFEAIVYVLRIGVQWNALPKEAGASSTVHDRFQEWERAGFFRALWQADLGEYVGLHHLTPVCYNQEQAYIDHFPLWL